MARIEIWAPLSEKKTMPIVAAALVLASPALILAIVATVTESALLGWIALAVALAVGAGAIVAGVFVGGRTLDRTGPSLLARIKTFPT